MSNGADIIPFDRKAEPEASPFTPDERAQIMGTLSAVMDAQASFEQQMKLAIQIIAELQSHVRDLQHHVARLQTAQGKKPAILNAQGARAN